MPRTQIPPPGPQGYAEALRAMRPALVAVFGFSAMVNVLMLTGSIYMLQVYDRVLSSGSVPTLLALFGIVVVLYACLGFYDFLRVRLLSRLGLRMDRTLGEMAFRRGLCGGAMVRDLDTVRGSLVSPATTALFDLPFVPLFVGLLFILHSWLGWLTLAGAAVAGILAMAGRILTRRAVARSSDPEMAAQAIEAGARRATETVAALDLSDRLARRWRALRDRQFAAMQTGGDPAEMLSAFSKSFRMLLQSSILTLGAYLVLAGEMSAGMIIASSILSGRALAPIDQIAGQAAVIARVRAAHARLLEGLERDVPDERIDLPTPTGRIEVEGLVRLVPAGAGAAPAAEPRRILSDVSFALEPGEVLGVVGPSGSGKSTLARLLVGALSADGGEIRIDGATLDQWTPAARRTFLGYLPQRIDMLPGTIRDNIAGFDPETRDDTVIEAALRAGVHEMILKLPHGYATRIEEIGLSGGQMQRIALARAIYGDPRFIVLDEPNSNLDAKGERALAETIRDLAARGTTVVLVTHRSEILSAATKLLVIDEGRVARFGSIRETGEGPSSSVRLTAPPKIVTRPANMGECPLPGTPSETALPPTTASKRPRAGTPRYRVSQKASA